MNIPDYIHYYIDSTATYRLRYVDQPAGQWRVPLRVTSKRVSKLDDASIEAIELFLRQLNSMTEEEALHIADLLNFGRVASDGAKIHQVKQMLGSVYYFNKFYTISAAKYVELFHYLLRQGFDLFGLIDAGLAVDKNEIK